MYTINTIDKTGEVKINLAHYHALKDFCDEILKNNRVRIFDPTYPFQSFCSLNKDDFDQKMVELNSSMEFKLSDSKKQREANLREIIALEQRNKELNEKVVRLEKLVIDKNLRITELSIVLEKLKQKKSKLIPWFLR